MIEIFYINLDSQPERRARIEQQFDDLGLKATRIRATTPSEVPAEVRRKYGSQWRVLPMTGGELACSSSHLEAMRRIAAGPNRYGAVFEDDAILSQHLPEFLAALDTSTVDLDLIKLDSSGDLIRILNRSAPVVADISLRTVVSNRAVTTGYIIDRATCSTVLRYRNVFSRPIDEILYHPAFGLSFAINTGHAEPALCKQPPIEGDSDSTIDADRRVRNTNHSVARAVALKVNAFVRNDLIFGTRKTLRQLVAGGATKRRIEFRAN